MQSRHGVYLIDTDVISELRKKETTNPGVVAFFKEVSSSDAPLYLAAVTIGELRRGVELVRHRGDARQAQMLERWLDTLLADFGDSVLAFDADVAQVWAVYECRIPRIRSTSSILKSTRQNRCASVRTERKST